LLDLGPQPFFFLAQLWRELGAEILRFEHRRISISPSTPVGIRTALHPVDRFLHRPHLPHQ
jgi:hypothetical protein